MRRVGRAACVALAVGISFAAAGGCASAGDSSGAGAIGGAGGIDGGDAAGGTGGLDAGTDAPGFDAGTDSGGGDGGTDECVAEDTCGDGLDNDCDGAVDEDCSCVPGTVSSCYRGPASTRGRGECTDGSMSCVGSTEFGMWDACSGDVLPDAEVCDEAGRDEDCDGSVNEDCECPVGAPPQPCGSDVGRCSVGQQRCIEGKLGPCENAVFPLPEACNDVDDDCDGAVDEDLTRPCGSSVGSCVPGVQVCSAGDWGECTGGTPIVDEVCNGIDDDCDGDVDEGVTASCGSDDGECVAGTRACVGGQFGACTGETKPATETCNGLDDDCDGQVDEDLTRPCGSDEGRCEAGTETCTMGTWGSCMGQVAPIAEVCEGSVDEDCDGAVDNGCGCTNMMTRKCGSDVGECVRGDQLCTGGTWGACTGGVTQQPEVCDGKDNDCDNQTDEGCACVLNETRPCGSDVGECSFGVETCDINGTWGACTGGQGPDMEVCDGKDNNCNGQTDEGGVCPKFPPTVSCPGDQSTLVGSAVTLSGGGSDPDGGSVTFDWQVVSAPPASSAQPNPDNAASTQFTPDQPGSYRLRLCVTDDESETRCCTTDVQAQSPCTPPTAPTVDTCGISWDRRPIVEFDAVPSGIRYEVWRQGDGAPLATVTQQGANYYRPASAISAGAAPPGQNATLFVRACRNSDPSCCATSNTVSTALIEQCTTAIAPTASNVLFSEYLVNGDGGSCPGDSCEAGEAIEITNLSHCPVSLNGHHFSYLNNGGSAARWMDFTASDVIPPRGVYVAVRNVTASTCSFPFFGADDPGLFGLKISTLQMNGSGLTNGWFNNSGGGSSQLRFATGAYSGPTSGTTVAIISPYQSGSQNCQSTGFDAIGACGEIGGGAVPGTTLMPNQLGRLWQPCDAVTSPVPASCN